MITGPAAAGLEVETPGDCRSSVTPSLRLLRLGGSTGKSVAGLQWPGTAAERAPANDQPGCWISLSGNDALNASQRTRIRGPGRGAAAQARSEASSVDSNGGPDRDPRAGQSEE
jgi:hypothetical protein